MSISYSICRFMKSSILEVFLEFHQQSSVWIYKHKLNTMKEKRCFNFQLGKQVQNNKEPTGYNFHTSVDCLTPNAFA